MARNHNSRMSFFNGDVNLTIWWDPQSPNVINVCTGDPRFVDDEGGRPGFWLNVRPADRKQWNRLARALREAGHAGPPLAA